MDMMRFGTFRMLFLIDEGGRLDIVRGKIHTLERSIHALSLSSRNYVRSNKTPFHTRVLLSIISIPGMRVSCKRLTFNREQFKILRVGRWQMQGKGRDGRGKGSALCQKGLLD